MPRRDWTFDEITMAFVLYFILESREIDASTLEIQQLGEAIGRTANAVKMKIGNISSGDHNRTSRGLVGLPHGSRLEQTVWNHFIERGDEFLIEGIELLISTLEEAGFERPRKLKSNAPEGKESIVETTARTNQTYFRNCLLDNYQQRCCLTGLAIPDLLIASHIKPWKVSDPKTERLNPCNGLLLNAFHDKAFDNGFITLDKSFKIVVSPKVHHSDATDEMLWKFSGSKIELPAWMPPSKEFIEYHNDEVFLA